MEGFLKNLTASLALRARKTLGGGALRPAAVLVPFFEKAGEFYLLLTKRSDGVHRHRGEIAFPGGRCEPHDPGLLETALRECKEEIGLDPAVVGLIGPLDDQVTVTGFCVSPFVGAIPYPYSFLLDPAEVTELIEVPFEFLMDPENCRHRTILFRDEPRTIVSYVYLGHEIWGATAEIIQSLVRIVHETGCHPATHSFSEERHEEWFEL